MRRLAIFITALLCHTALAEDFKIPTLTGAVVDDANMLDPRTRDAIEEYLRALRDQGGSQVTVATVEDIGDLPIEQASIKITDAWKLGSDKQDDGILLLIAAKQRRIRIEVGQGREGALPDAIASRIIREIMVPRMQRSGVDRAVLAGVQAIVSYADPEIAQKLSLGGQVHRERHETRGSKLLMGLLWLGLLALMIGGNRFLGPGLLAGGLLGRRSGGWGGGFGGGGFGGGGGGNDDWSGGGGGFSGGGSSGEW